MARIAKSRGSTQIKPPPAVDKCYCVDLVRENWIPLTHKSHHIFAPRLSLSGHPTSQAVGINSHSQTPLPISNPLYDFLGCVYMMCEGRKGIGCTNKFFQHFIKANVVTLAACIWIPPFPPAPCFPFLYHSPWYCLTLTTMQRFKFSREMNTYTSFSWAMPNKEVTFSSKFMKISSVESFSFTNILEKHILVNINYSIVTF